MATSNDQFSVYDSLDAVYSSSTLSLQKERYAALVDKFKARYGVNPDFFARSPGRVNIIGT
ncbi:hypothetical protein HDU76_009838, partial [Blyttiomyces sp. JEL0837]